MSEKDFDEGCAAAAAEMHKHIEKHAGRYLVAALDTRTGRYHGSSNVPPEALDLFVTELRQDIDDGSIGDLRPKVVDDSERKAALAEAVQTVFGDRRGKV